MADGSCTLADHHRMFGGYNRSRHNTNVKPALLRACAGFS
jgi:hypothetical protein